jgi:hypothetical protein
VRGSLPLTGGEDLPDGLVIRREREEEEAIDMAAPRTEAERAERHVPPNSFSTPLGITSITIRRGQLLPVFVPGSSATPLTASSTSTDAARCRGRRRAW